MKFGKRDKSIVDALFLLALFGVFLICALFIVLFGAKIYKNTVEASEDSFFQRTCYTYITEKVRQNDNSNGVSIYNKDGATIIELTKTINDNDYVTYIFADNGYLKEYTTSAGNSFNAAGATEIIEVSSMTAEKCNDNLYRFSICDKNGHMTSFYTSITSDVDAKSFSEDSDTTVGGVADE